MRLTLAGLAVLILAALLVTYSDATCRQDLPTLMSDMVFGLTPKSAAMA